jgi:hypothetical protein
MDKNLKLDIFPHIFPLAYFERMKQIAGRNPALAAQLKRWMHIPVLWDLEQRIRMMKKFPGYKQVLTLSMPAVEFLGTPEETPELARLANDGMAEIVRQHPELFPAFVASLPMNNVPAALEEMDRAIAKLGAKGVQIFTNVNGRPLDDPEFFRLFERMSKTYDLPVWVHPTRTAKFAIMLPRKRASTRCGGCSAGPTRPACSWAAWCSRACSTSCRSSRSSPTTSARWCRSSATASATAWTSSAAAPRMKTTKACASA